MTAREDNLAVYRPSDIDSHRYLESARLLIDILGKKYPSVRELERDTKKFMPKTRSCIDLNQGRVAGALVSEVDIDNPENPALIIKYVGVHNDYRGKHVGVRLIHDLEEFAREVEIPRVCLQTSLSSHDKFNVVRWYEHIGYNVTSKTPDVVNRRDMYLMQRTLQPILPTQETSLLQP